MVRLKASPGSIRMLTERNFNSTMVRLKDYTDDWDDFVRQ